VLRAGRRRSTVPADDTHIFDNVDEMNRKQRRAKIKYTGLAASPLAASSPRPPEKTEDIYAAVMSHYRLGEFESAETLCRALLQRNPRHVPSLVLLGDMVQQDGRNKSALKLLGQALALDPGNAAAHDNIGMAYQALGRRDDAVRHFSQAVASGLRDPEMLVKRSAVIAAPLRRLDAAWPRQLHLAELLGPQGAGPLASEALLVALLQSKVVCDFDLERLLTAIRRGLLQHAIDGGPDIIDAGSLEFFCALAQQCFINEYVFALGNAERSQVATISDRIVGALKVTADIAPLDLIAVASYLPLHTLPMVASLLNRPWPDVIVRLMTQQTREPLEEALDHVPRLTCIADATSLQVQSQYEQNPYPRWNTLAPIKPTIIGEFLWERLRTPVVSWPRTAQGVDFLIAGCGTGQHSIDTALRFPKSRILAIDVSRASLAYARRKTREAGVTNVEYGQADILELAALDRQFDVIEAVGVLHHLSDPGAGWRLLLSLLRPDGLMLVGLYSAAARRSLTAARELIAQRGYRPTPDDIRACRQDLLLRGNPPPFTDFSSTSGCRDLLFNVMEHQFTLPQIDAFLEVNNLNFLGFEQCPAGAYQQFQQQFAQTDAVRDLKTWDHFEQMHPMTFANMYVFWVQKRGRDRLRVVERAADRPTADSLF